MPVPRATCFWQREFSGSPQGTKGQRQRPRPSPGIARLGEDAAASCGEGRVAGTGGLAPTAAEGPRPAS